MGQETRPESITKVATTLSHTDFMFEVSRPSYCGARRDTRQHLQSAICGPTYQAAL